MCFFGLLPCPSIIEIFSTKSFLLQNKAPPSPEVNIFVPCIEITPKSPIEPAFLPLYSEPTDSAASSMIGTPYFSPIAIISSISTKFP